MVNGDDFLSKAEAVSLIGNLQWWWQWWWQCDGKLVWDDGSDGNDVGTMLNEFSTKVVKGVPLSWLRGWQIGIIMICCPMSLQQKPPWGCPHYEMIPNESLMKATKGMPAWFDSQWVCDEGDHGDVIIMIDAQRVCDEGHLRQDLMASESAIKAASATAIATMNASTAKNRPSTPILDVLRSFW